jgi:hypothetical protein
LKKQTDRVVEAAGVTRQWVMLRGQFIDKAGWGLIWSCLCSHIKEIGLHRLMKFVGMKTGDLLIFGPE